MAKHVVIFGAGKIGRGFIAPLFYRNGYLPVFADNDVQLVRQLNKSGAYRIAIAGKPSKTEKIPVMSAFHLSEKDGLRKVLLDTGIMASAVGAANLTRVASTVGELTASSRSRPLNWFICENAHRPKQTILATLQKGNWPDRKAFIEKNLGLIETQVLRTGMQPPRAVKDKEPLTVKMQEWCELPFDIEAFKGEWPGLKGFLPKKKFANELVRKLYTFNGLNGPLSYAGWLKGHQYLHQAALDPGLQNFIREILSESAHGLIHEFGFDKTGHRAFQQMALDKYRNEALEDPIERNAADPTRKLGINERLLGPALLCLKHGRFPEAYCQAIASALAYSGDGAGVLPQKVSMHGAVMTLCELSGLSREHPVCKRVETLSAYFCKE